MQDIFNKMRTVLLVGCALVLLLAFGQGMGFFPSIQAVQSTLTNLVVARPDLPQAFTDSGSPTEVLLIKKQIPTLIATDTSLSRFSAEQLGDSDWLASKLTGPEVPAQVKQIWVPEKVDSRVADVRAGFELVASETNPTTFTDNRFVVTRWLGVDVGDGAGRAVFDGHHEYLVEDGWLSSHDLRWEIEFETVGEGLDARLLFKNMAGFGSGG